MHACSNQQVVSVPRTQHAPILSQWTQKMKKIYEKIWIHHAFEYSDMFDMFPLCMTSQRQLTRVSERPVSMIIGHVMQFQQVKSILPNTREWLRSRMYIWSACG